MKKTTLTLGRAAVFALCLGQAGLAAAQTTGGPPATGTVTDGANHTALPGATVVVKGTTQGASTDADGRFSLPGVAPGATLIISAIGYEKREVKVGARCRASRSGKPGRRQTAPRG
ncbi:MAG: carboxypeptidase-like regulatory domain-containing protein, partial [Hymenobacter sp.]